MKSTWFLFIGPSKGSNFEFTIKNDIHESGFNFSLNFMVGFKGDLTLLNLYRKSKTGKEGT